MMDVARRDILLKGLKTIAAVQFLRFAIVTKAYAATVATDINAWCTELEVMARDFRNDRLTFAQWHAAIHALYKRVPMPDLLKQIHFEEIRPRLMALGQGEHFEQLGLPSITGYERPFSSSIFGVTPRSHIPPHGHNNLVTAHMILQGQLRTRTFERLHDEQGRITVKPTRDIVADIGTTVTMSEDIENVHWFEAGNEHTFSFQISARVPNVKDYMNVAGHDGRVYLDLRGKPRGDGTIEAPVIDEAKSHSLYSVYTSSACTSATK
jgi:hypothetical protein